MNKPYSPLPDTLTDATHLTDVQGGGRAAEAERAKSNVASESKSRRNYWPLVVLLFVIFTGGGLGYWYWQAHLSAGVLKDRIGGTASSKSALSGADKSPAGKKLGVEDKSDVLPNSPDPAPPQVPAINRDYNVQPAQPIALQPGAGANAPPPRSRYDAPSSFDGAMTQIANNGVNAAGKAVNTVKARTDYSVPPVTPTPSVTPQPYDKNALNLSTTKTPTAKASMIGNRDFILPKGAFIDCDLDTAINSTVPGMVRCTVTKDAYSDNGRVVLVGRGSTITGEYQSGVQNGQARIQVIWNRIKTPEGAVIEPSSPASDSLGRGGVDGDVEKHWMDRLGAAFLTSFIKDVVAYETAKNSSGSQTNSGYQNITQSGNQLSSQILNSTLNIAPTITRNQGTRLKVYLARDLDFSNVYSLRVVN